jgi:hypothetical protein
VRPNRPGLKAGPLASSLKRARNLHNEEGGGSEEAGLAFLEAEAEASLEAASLEAEAAAAAEAVEAGEALKSLEESAENPNQCQFLQCQV